jgi:hypothetical protein
MYPKDKAGGAGFAALRVYVPGRALGFGTRATGTPLTAPEDGSWSFVLQPLGGSATRLLIRGRGAAGRSLLGVAFDRAIFEPVHFVMGRRTMVGLAQLAEGSERHRFLNHIHVALWTVTLGLIVAAAVMVMRRRRWLRPLAGFVAAAVVSQVLTLGQPRLPSAQPWLRRCAASCGGLAEERNTRPRNGRKRPNPEVRMERRHMVGLAAAVAFAGTLTNVLPMVPLAVGEAQHPLL